MNSTLAHNQESGDRKNREIPRRCSDSTAVDGTRRPRIQTPTAHVREHLEELVAIIARMKPTNGDATTDYLGSATIILGDALLDLAALDDQLIDKDPSPPTPSTSRTLGPFAIALRIACAMQRLALLEWALSARLDDGSEYEVFTNPITAAMKDLEDLRTELHALGPTATIAKEVR